MTRRARTCISIIIMSISSMTGPIAVPAAAQSSVNTVISCKLINGGAPALKNYVTNTANVNGLDDVVDLKPGCTYTLSAPIDVWSDAHHVLTIDGNGATISGNDAGRVFNVHPAATLRLVDVTISSGRSTTGGGIHNRGTLSLVSSRVTNSFAMSGPGGGIYNEGAVTLVNAEIESNGARRGGGIYNNHGGQVKVTVGSSVAGNIAKLQGGGIRNEGGSVWVLMDSQVSGNSVTAPTGDGGGISNLGYLRVDHSTIDHNSAYAGAGILSYGEVVLENGAAVSDNNAEHGAGIYNGSGLRVVDSTISDNTAHGHGGGIYNPGGVRLTRSSLTNNVAETGNGGGIFVDAPFYPAMSANVTLFRSTLSQNRADQGDGGGIYNLKGRVRSEASTVSFNRAKKDGSGIYNTDGGSVDLLAHSAVTQNGLADSGRGGGVYNVGVLFMSESSITRNSALSGGGVASYGKVDMTNDSSLQYNTAIDGGGAYNGFVFNVRNSKVRFNVAALHGGGIHNVGVVSLTDSDMILNRAGELGGAVFNDATVYPSPVKLTFNRSRLMQNKADSAGGAIHNLGGEVLGITSTLANNLAPGGGAVHNEMEMGEATFSKTTFVGNVATVSDGGAIANVEDGFVSILNASRFDNNRAAQNGGGIANISADAEVARSLFVRNRAEGGGGGAVFNDFEGDVSVSTSTISTNTAPSGGGIQNHGVASVATSTFSDNTATNPSREGGGAIANWGVPATLEVTRSTFNDNVSSARGGGVSNAASPGKFPKGTATLSNVTFWKNRAAVAGGAISTPAGTMKILHATIARNQAPVSGGIEGSLTIDNSILFDNAGGNCGSVASATVVGSSNLVFPVTSPCGAFQVGDPVLGNLAPNGGPTQTIEIFSGSAAIDAAAASNCLPRDQRGRRRADGDGDTLVECDIGAFEYKGW